MNKINNLTSPKISIAIPVYNEEKTILDLLESLYIQSYRPDEIIISDGGSTDSTIEIINNFTNKKKDINIKIVGRQNYCRGSGRNMAIKHCKNQFIALIDSGHRANKDWLNSFVNTLKINSDADIIYGSVVPNTNGYFNKILSSFLLGNRKHDGKINKSVASILIRKNILKVIGLFRESLDGKYIVEDLDFLKKIKANKDINEKYSESSFTYWYPAENLFQFYKKYLTYSIGAVKAGYFNVWHAKVLRNMFIFFFIIFLSIVYSKLFILLILFFIILRSVLYLNKNSWYNKSSILIKFKYIFGKSFLLLLIDYIAILGLLLSIFKI